MDCLKCNLRYNTTLRKPKINQCGHSLCSICVNKLLLCPLCQTIIDKSKSIVNEALMQMLQERKNSKEIDKLIKICFVGQSKVGKTSIINRLKGQQYKQNTIATIGYDFAFEDRIIQSLNIRFQLWDSAGQQRYRAVSPLHYKNSDIVIIAYDISQDGKTNNTFSWYEQATKHCPQDCIKIFLGNKMDLLQNNDKSTKPVNSLQPQTWKVIASERMSNYYVSCKTYEGIQQFWTIMDENVKKILKRVVLTENPYRKPSSQIMPDKVMNPINKSKLKQGKSSKLMSKQQLRQEHTCC